MKTTPLSWLRRILICAFACCVLSCSKTPKPFAFLGYLSGQRESNSIVEQQPLVLSAAPRTFKLSPPAEVVGHRADLCVVLAHGVSMVESEATHARLTNGVKFKADVETADGKHFALGDGGHSWRKFGVLEGSDEIAVCTNRGCDTPLPLETKLAAVTITATREISVLGIYWESENSFDRIELPKPATAARVAGQAESKCSRSS